MDDVTITMTWYQAASMSLFTAIGMWRVAYGIVLMLQAGNHKDEGGGR